MEARMTAVLDHPDACVRIEEKEGGKRVISVEPQVSLVVPVRM
jgi:hypothetical protein